MHDLLGIHLFVSAWKKMQIAFDHQFHQDEIRNLHAVLLLHPQFAI